MTTVIYHKSDFDGLFCREIAKSYLGTDATYIGYEYGDTVPSVGDDEDIYMLDISIPEMMNHRRLVWIDHHATAIEKYKDIQPMHGVRIDGVAACRLAWQYFYVGSVFPAKQKFIDRIVNEPLAVRLAGEYDVWDKRDPRAELFQHGLRSRELTEQLWHNLLSFDKDHIVDELLTRGSAIEYYVKSQNAEIIKSIGFDLDFEGLHFLALNTARYNSLNFEAGLKPEHDGCFGFKWTGDKWSVSLYGVPGKPEIDLSAIAKKWGGGGHKQACGFTAQSLPFMEVTQ
jgi:oligoribonuclease NrnB/cAMP/cGMP phosphodiesterase (DHH superfamily)